MAHEALSGLGNWLALRPQAALDGAALPPCEPDPAHFSMHPVFAQVVLLGQMHADESFAPPAQGPAHFSMHPVFAQVVLLGQMHADGSFSPPAQGPAHFSMHPVWAQDDDPAAPKANPIPASSRIIEAIASLLICTTLSIISNLHVQISDSLYKHMTIWIWARSLRFSG